MEVSTYKEKDKYKYKLKSDSDRVLDRVARIWVVFDSSGSTMGDRMLFLSEVIGLMEKQSNRTN